jgi:hypothetical protein
VVAASSNAANVSGRWRFIIAFPQRSLDRFTDLSDAW